jgi:CTP:phosphocholine cytidylyltransferase-like protein
LSEEKVSKAMGYSLVNAELSYTSKALDNVRRVEKVIEVHPLYEIVSGIAYVEADGLEELKQILAWKVRKCDNVRSTWDMVVQVDGKEQPIGFKKDASGKIVYENIPDRSEFRLPK